MTKIFKISISFFLLTIFVLVKPVFASNLVSAEGTVMEVIGGDSLKVVDSSKKIYYIKLLGVNTNGNDFAFEYLNNELLGKNIFFSSDSNYSKSNSSVWFYTYVYYEGKLINKIILEKGLGYLNRENKSIVRYFELLQSENFAKSKRLGVWENEPEIVVLEKPKYKVNVNTASLYQLNTLLFDIDNELAKNIVEYRQKYEFNSLEDLKNIDGFTNNIFEKNSEYMTLYTNINNASAIELTTLTNITSYDAKDIVDYASNTKFKIIEELYREGIISMTKFSKIRYFIRAY